MKGEPEIGTIEFHDDGTNLIVKVQVKNPSDRTLHLYASPRGMRYDEATKVLRILLSDENLGENAPGSIFVLPRFTTVDAHGQAEITLKLPRFLTRLAPGAGQTSPKLERLPIHEAAAVEVDISWSDKPFYSDPRKKKTAVREQLVSWQSGTVRKRSGSGTRPKQK